MSDFSSAFPFPKNGNRDNSELNMLTTVTKCTGRMRATCRTEFPHLPSILSSILQFPIWEDGKQKNRTKSDKNGLVWNGPNRAEFHQEKTAEAAMNAVYLPDDVRLSH